MRARGPCLTLAVLWALLVGPPGRADIDPGVVCLPSHESAVICDGDVLATDLGRDQLIRIYRPSDPTDSGEKVLTNIPGSPRGLAVDSHGYMYVHETVSDQLFRYDPETGAADPIWPLLNTTPAFTLAEEMLFDARGNLLVVEPYVDGVYRVDPISPRNPLPLAFSETDFSGSPEPSVPKGLAIDPDAAADPTRKDVWYIADASSLRPAVYKVDFNDFPYDAVGVTDPDAPGFLDEPNDVAIFDRDHSVPGDHLLLVTDNDAGLVFWLDPRLEHRSPDPSKILLQSPDLVAPVALHVVDEDGDGHDDHFWLTDNGRDEILEYSFAGTGTCSNGGSSCNFDSDCADSVCSDDASICSNASDCGSCSDDQSACSEDADCGGRECSDDQSACTRDGDCGPRTCSDNAAACLSDGDCNTGATCDFSATCDFPATCEFNATCDAPATCDLDPPMLVRTITGFTTPWRVVVVKGLEPPDREPLVVADQDTDPTTDYDPNFNGAEDRLVRIVMGTPYSQTGDPVQFELTLDQGDLSQITVGNHLSEPLGVAVDPIDPTPDPPDDGINHAYVVSDRGLHGALPDVVQAIDDSVDGPDMGMEPDGNGSQVSSGFTASDPIAAPFRALVDSFGDVLVADPELGRILRIEDPWGAATLSIVAEEQDLCGDPVDLTLDADGVLVVLNRAPLDLPPECERFTPLVRMIPDKLPGGLTVPPLSERIFPVPTFAQIFDPVDVEVDTNGEAVVLDGVSGEFDPQFTVPGIIRVGMKDGVVSPKLYTSVLMNRPNGMVLDGTREPVFSDLGDPESTIFNRPGLVRVNPVSGVMYGITDEILTGPDGVPGGGDDEAVYLPFDAPQGIARDPETPVPPTAFNDLDLDGFGPTYDNCPAGDAECNGNDVGKPDCYNPDQSDVNGDGFGDVCQPDDPDEDGWPENQDNCPTSPEAQQALCLTPPSDWLPTDPFFVSGCPVCSGMGCSNPGSPQPDANFDGIGDACQPYDADQDGIPEDNDGNPNTDYDGNPATNEEPPPCTGGAVVFCADNCPGVQNPGQEDINEDGIGDACQNDYPPGSDPDGDGIPSDGDGSGTPGDNPCTTNQAVDCDDNCPNDANPDQFDRHAEDPNNPGFGIGEVCDDTADGDGLPDAEDNCPDVANPDQEDLDMDGIGNACDNDVEGDGAIDFLPDPGPDGIPGNGDDPAGMYVRDDNCVPVVLECGIACDEAATGMPGGFAIDPALCHGDPAFVACYNPTQSDLNDDGFGDICQPDDPDLDGWPEIDDNCPVEIDGQPNACIGSDPDQHPCYDPLQLDINGDGIGDICQPDDPDGDGIPSDGDGSGTAGDAPCAPPPAQPIACDDNCPNAANFQQADSDMSADPGPDGELGTADDTIVLGDGIGDACDDSDTTTGMFDGPPAPDGVRDGCADLETNCSPDNCIYVVNPDQSDVNSDGMGDACQADDPDADGWPEGFDNCPVQTGGQPTACTGTVAGEDPCFNPLQQDIDGDGAGDVCDVDRDGDTIDDAMDNCLDVPNPGQEDADMDGYGNACDADVDGDGLVGVPDFLLFVAAYGSQPGDANWNAGADFDGSGQVGLPDFQFFNSHYGKPAGPSGYACAGTPVCP